MKICTNCGFQLADEAAVCSHCGTAAPAANNTPYHQLYQQPPYSQTPYQQTPYQQSPYQQNPYQQPYVETESSTLAICALVFAFIIPIVGLVCGIIGVCKYKTPSYKSRSIAAIIISIIVYIFSVFITMGGF